MLKERRLRCKDGRFLWVEISAQMLTDGQFLAIVRDISKRKQAEEQLSESNKRFQLLAESSLTGIYLIQENQFRYVNPAMAYLFGYEVEEIIDKLGPMDLVYQDDRPLLTENLRRRIEGEVEAVHYDFRGLCKDGHVINVDVHGRRIEYDGKIGVIGTLVDITERKQAEEALRSSQERLQLAASAAQMGEWEWNIVTGEVVWSPQCLALYGLPPDTQMDYEQFLKALHPDDRERVDASLNRAVNEGIGYDEQKRTIWPDGSLHWTASRGQVFYDDTGQPMRMVGVTFDITKLKAAEDKLRASEPRFRTFVDHAADAFFLHDEQGIIRDVNRQSCESLGYSRQELIGMTPFDIDASPIHPFDDQLFAQLSAGEVVVFEGMHRRKDGSVFPVEVRTRPFLQSEEVFGVSLARDITERKQIEQTLTQREQEYRALVENSPDFIARNDREFRRIYINPAIEKLFGKPAEKILNTAPNTESPIVAPQV